MLKILPADLLKILPTDLLMIWLSLVQNFTYILFQDLINRLAQYWFTDKLQNVSWYNLQNNFVMIRPTDIFMIWQTCFSSDLLMIRLTDLFISQLENMFITWLTYGQDVTNKLVQILTYRLVQDLYKFWLKNLLKHWLTELFKILHTK